MIDHLSQGRIPRSICRPPWLVEEEGLNVLSLSSNKIYRLKKSGNKREMVVKPAIHQNSAVSNHGDISPCSKALLGKF